MISIGVDVSKGKSMVCFLKPLEVQHTESDLRNLVEKIKALDDEARVVMEATGAYHYPILTYLQEQGVFVSVINPLVMSKYVNVAIRKSKTDVLDSIKIANYGLDYWFRLVNHTVNSDTYEELKVLNRQYLSYICMRIKAKQNLTNLLDRTMPGIKTLLLNHSSNPDRDKLCDFVKDYWHYDNIICMSETKFIKNYMKRTKKKGYQFSEVKAKKIFALALDSIPTLASTLPSTQMLVLEAVKSLHMIDMTLITILTQMRSLAKTLKEYDIVMSMPGVGDILGPRIIAEIGNIRRFHSASALVAYAGIDAPPYQSGKFTATNRSISKRGSASLRKTGYEIMRYLKISKPQIDNAVYLYMLKKESEGKPLKVAKIAALNKFLRIYYARVKEVYVQ